MEFTQEKIDSLTVNEVEIMKKIAEELNIKVPQVSAVISLVQEGCTIPFIARYRKEKHGSLDELQVRECDHLFTSYKNLEERRLEIVKGIFNQNKLTESLYNAAMGAKTLSELEDLWAPFKKKKKTRGMVAQEKGLEPLADAMYDLDDAALLEKAKEFIKTDNEDSALNVETSEDAIAAQRILLPSVLLRIPRTAKQSIRFIWKPAQLSQKELFQTDRMPRLLKKLLHIKCTGITANR